MAKRNNENYDIAGVFRDMEDYLIDSMKRNLGSHLDEEELYGFKWEQWQSKKLRELMKFQRRNVLLVRKYRSKIGLRTRLHLLQEFLQGGKKIDKEFSTAIKKGFTLKRGKPGNEFFQGESKLINNLIMSVDDDFEKACNAALRKMDDVYRQTVFKASVFAGTGTMTPKQAIDMATKDFLTKGIDCIVYKNGACVNIASYAEMAIRTAGRRAQLMGEGERRKEWGESLVQISQYALCSKLCLPWQGCVYIDDVYSGGKKGDGDYPLLSEAIAGGLFHPNCKHTSSTFFPGISDEPVLMYSEGNTDIKAAYEKRQARKFERLKNGSLDRQNIEKYAIKEEEHKK